MPYHTSNTGCVLESGFRKLLTTGRPTLHLEGGQSNIAIMYMYIYNISVLLVFGDNH